MSNASDFAYMLACFRSFLPVAFLEQQSWGTLGTEPAWCQPSLMPMYVQHGVLLAAYHQKDTVFTNCGSICDSRNTKPIIAWL